MKEAIAVNIMKSVSDNQSEIIASIMSLYCPAGFDLDPTYSKGVFYKKIPEPKLKYDLEPQIDDVLRADCRKLPLSNNSLASIMFDPPFVGGSRKDGKPGIIKERFGYYKTVPILWKFYRDAMDEFYRLLKPSGILVFKCQDTVECGKQYMSHVEITNYAYKIGFYPLDLFVLTAKNRLISPNQRQQQHSRKYHSYFLVFRKATRLVAYTSNTDWGMR